MTRKNSEVRQHEIIQATMEIIAEQGIQNFTMATLAKRIGITDGALYKHFTSKKDILMSMVAEVIRGLSTFMNPMVIPAAIQPMVPSTLTPGNCLPGSSIW